MRRRHLMPVLQGLANAIFFNVLLSAQAIRERIGELTDRAQAIIDIAQAANRDLTDEEKSEIDGILGVGRKGASGHKPGQIDGLERDLERAELLEARQAELAEIRDLGGARQAVTPTQRADGPQDGPDAPGDRQPANRPRAAAIHVPAASQYRHCRMQAYRGEYADERAYMAGMFLLATMGRNQQARQWCNTHHVDCEYRAALSGSDNSLGGFLVPVEMEQAIIDLREEYGVFRRNARIVPMASDTKNQPVRKSGLTAYFVGEGEDITESEKGWGNSKLVAKKLASLSKYSNEIDEDAIISIADDLTREMAYAFAVKEDNCGFNGDGTSTYGGIVGLKSALAAGSIAESLAGNITFATLDMVDFEAAIGKLPEYPGIQAKWHISKPGWAASMLRLLDAAGGNTAAMLAAGREVMFLGYPVEWAAAMPKALSSTASTILAYFGDLRMAVNLGNRRGMSIAVSDQRYFESDQLGIRGIERFDITVHSPGDASNPGPIVAVKTPAS